MLHRRMSTNQGGFRCSLAESQEVATQHPRRSGSARRWQNENDDGIAQPTKWALRGWARIRSCSLRKGEVWKRRRPTHVLRRLVPSLALVDEAAGWTESAPSQSIPDFGGWAGPATL